MAKVAPVVGAIGGAVGGFFMGGPMGALQGAYMGYTAGMMFKALKTKPPAIEEAKLQLNRTMSSSAGTPINKLYGRNKVSGNLIWSTEIKETQHSKKEGGKGGRKQEYKWFTYSVECALALGQGPIAGIGKIWFDGKLVFNPSAAPVDGQGGEFWNGNAIDQNGNEAGFGRWRFIVYKGGEDQEPCAEIQIHQPDTPAYKGLAYIYFNFEDLADDGNRIPNVEVEVFESGAVPTNDLKRLSFEKNRVYGLFDTIGWNGDANDPNLNKYYSQTRLSDVHTDASSLNFTNDNDYYFKILQKKSRTFNVFASGMASVYDDVNNYDNYDFYNYKKSYAVSEFGEFYMMNDTIMFNNIVIMNTNISHFVDVFICSPKSIFILYDNHDYSSLVLKFIKITATSSSTISQSEPFIYKGTKTKNIDGTYTYNNNNRNIFVSNRCLIEDTSQFIYTIGSGFNDGSISIYKYDESDMYVEFISIWRRPINPSLEDHEDFDSFEINAVAPMIYGNSLKVVSFSRFNNNGVYEDYLIEETFSLFSAQETGFTTLDKVVKDVLLRSGYTEDQIDVSDILDIPFVGCFFEGNRLPKDFLSDLMPIFLFDMIESNNKIVLRKRNGITVKDIDIKDVNCNFTENDDAIIEEDISAFSDLPSQVEVSYSSIESRFEQNVQSYINSSAYYENKFSVGTSVVLKDEQAAKMAAQLLEIAHIEKSSYSFNLPSCHIDLEPSDVINLGGRILRIISAVYTANGIIEVSCVKDASSIYNVTVSPVVPDLPSHEIKPVGKTFFKVLDIPSLSELDVLVPKLYFVFYSNIEDWSGGVITESINGSPNYETIATSKTQSVVGKTTQKLNAGKTCGYDKENFISVELPDWFELESVTDDDIYNNKNVCLVGKHGRYEVIQFKNAVLNEYGEWILTDLLRARLATEQHVSTHEADDDFILLDSNAIEFKNYSFNNRGAQITFKGTSLGQMQSNSNSAQITFEANNVKEFSVAKLEKNGNIISWIPRVRVNGGWNDYLDVNYSNLFFRVELYDASNALLSFEMTSNLSYTVTDANAVKAKVITFNQATGAGFSKEISLI